MKKVRIMKVKSKNNTYILEYILFIFLEITKNHNQNLKLFFSGLNLEEPILESNLVHFAQRKIYGLSII